MENEFENTTDEIVTVSDEVVEIELDDLSTDFVTAVGIKKEINIKIHGLMPEHEKNAIEMVKNGVPLGEIADHFGIARSDIVYINK